MIVPLLVAATAVALSATACTAGSKHDGATHATGANTGTAAAQRNAPAASSTPPPPAAPAQIAFGSLSVSAQNPAKPVSVAVHGGQLSSVKLVSASGTEVKGDVNDTKSSWTSAEALGYGKSYTLSASAVNADGKPSAKNVTFTTLNPPNMTMPYLDYIGGYALQNGATYGVGIVPMVHFDEPITDEKAAQATLKVTTDPPVAGSWYWADNQDVHYRPKTFWPSGTKVTISANVYGEQVSPGLYGQSDQSVSFTIGAKQITYAYDSAPKVDQVKVYRNNQLIKTMNTSMGKHSGEQVGDNYISFWTMKGTYTVLEHDNPAIMSSASYGLPANAPGGYAPEPIYYSTKISIDGIYLHELDSTVWDQNNGYDVSHGCLNLSQANAIWYYNNSHIGDPVIISNPQAPTISVAQGGDWSVPWSTWVAGGAS